MQAYDDSTAEAYKYFVINTQPLSNPQYKCRTKIFPDDEHCVIYLPKKEACSFFLLWGAEQKAAGYVPANDNVKTYMV